MDHGRFARPLAAESRDAEFDLDQLLHPAQAFDQPDDVVNDPDLTLNEKRAILSSWASDACAVESAPNLRRRPGAARTVTFDEVVDALKALDASARSTQAGGLKRQLRKQRLLRSAIAWRRSRSGSEGSALGA